MKKIFCVVLSMLFLLAGCGKASNKTAVTAPTENETATIESISKGSVVKEEQPPQVDTQNLSNEKNGWGFKKNEKSVPGFTENQIKTMEKFNCIYLGKEEKVVYLTFDEGYENGYTKEILDALRKHSVPAAFFITGSYFDNNGDLVDTMVKDGHIVGNHTVNHPSLPDKSEDEIKSEIEGLNDKFYKKYGINMKYIRPPMGEYSEKSLATTNNLGYTSVFWSFAYKDWEVDNQKGKDYALEEVKKYLHDGAVILLHAVSSDNATAMEEIILYIREMGYEFKSLDEYK